jgi:hypothetical protein
MATASDDVATAETESAIADSAAVPDSASASVLTEPAVEEAPFIEVKAKKRGRPAGAKNKPKIIETPVVEPVKTSVEPVETVKEPEVRLFTQEEVQELLMNSCRLQEQKIRDEKRERYAALFKKQKWTRA